MDPESRLFRFSCYCFTYGTGSMAAMRPDSIEPKEISRQGYLTFVKWKISSWYFNYWAKVGYSCTHQTTVDRCVCSRSVGWFEFSVSSFQCRSSARNEMKRTHFWFFVGMKNEKGEKDSCLYMRECARTRTDRMTGPLLFVVFIVKLLVLGLELP